MDELDLGILRVMGVGPAGATRVGEEHLKPPYLAKRLGTSVPTIRERLRRLESDGVIEGYRAFPNPRALGLDLHVQHVRLPEPRKAALLAKLRGVEGIGGYLEFLGEDAYVLMLLRDEPDARRKLALLDTLLEGPPRREIPRAPWPRPTREMDALDWRIVRALRADARRPLAQVADELGYSLKSVRARLDRLLECACVRVLPVVDRSAMHGVVFFHLLVEMQPDAGADDARRVAAMVDERAFFAYVDPARAHLFDAGLWARSPAEVADVAARALAAPHVREARALLPSGGYDNEEWLDEAIARAAAAAK